MNVDMTTIIIDEQHLTEEDVWLSLNELCERCHLKPPLLVKLVSLGLVTPEIVEPDRWLFRPTAVPTLHHAMRLRRELDLTWQGVAVAMDLLVQVRELRQQVYSLQRQMAIHK